MIITKIQKIFLKAENDTHNDQEMLHNEAHKHDAQKLINHEIHK